MTYFEDSPIYMRICQTVDAIETTLGELRAEFAGPPTAVLFFVCSAIE